jgi:hypothetical protein
MEICFGYIPPRWTEHRQPRINGDTRRRKRRLREKLAKKDQIKYGPMIRVMQAKLQRFMEEDLLQEMQKPQHQNFSFRRFSRALTRLRLGSKKQERGKE